MLLSIDQIIAVASERYPWTHRISMPKQIAVGDVVNFQCWIDNENIPGIWAGNSFYTTDQTATMIALKWSG